VIGKHDRIIKRAQRQHHEELGCRRRSRSIVSSFSALTFVYTEKEG